jgi:hypothetical protein
MLCFCFCFFFLRENVIKSYTFLLHATFRWACLMLPFWFESISFSLINVPWRDVDWRINLITLFLFYLQSLTAIHFRGCCLGVSVFVFLIQNLYLICHHWINLRKIEYYILVATNLDWTCGKYLEKGLSLSLSKWLTLMFSKTIYCWTSNLSPVQIQGTLVQRKFELFWYSHFCSLIICPY